MIFKKTSSLTLLLVSASVALLNGCGGRPIGEVICTAMTFGAEGCKPDALKNSLPSPTDQMAEFGLALNYPESANVGECVPVDVKLVDSGASPATAGRDIAIVLSGGSFFSDPACGLSTKIAKITSGLKTTTFYAVAAAKGSVEISVSSPDLKNKGIARASNSPIIVDPETRIVSTASNSGSLTITSAETISIVSGGGQLGTAGQTLALPITVLVLDDAGLPVSGYKVYFKAISGGSLSFNTSRTDASGLASTSYTLPTSSGTKIIEAGNLTLIADKSVSVSATALADAGFNLRDLTVPVGGTVGQPNTSGVLAIQILDQYGNPAPGVGVTWTATGGTLSSAAAATDDNGVSSITYVMPKTSGIFAITASTSLNGTAKTVNVPVTAIADQADHIEIASGDQQSGTVNVALPLPLRVRVLDQFGNPVAGMIVRFSSPTGSLSQASAVSDSMGISESVFQLPTSSGSIGVTAQTKELKGVNLVSFSEASHSGGAKSLIPISGSFKGEVVTALTSPISVRAVDEYGNPVSGVNINWSSISGQLSGFPSVTDLDGKASINLTLKSQAGPAEVLAQTGEHDGALTLTTRGVITPGAPTHTEVIGGKDQSAVIFTALPRSIQVTALDSYNNPVPNAAVSFSSKSGSFSASDTVTDSSALTDTQFTLGPKAGKQFFIVKLKNYAADDGNSVAYTAIPGPPATLTLSVPTQGSLGECLPLNIYLSDAGLNPVQATQELKVDLSGDMIFFDSLGCGETVAPILARGKTTILSHVRGATIGFKTITATSVTLPNGGTALSPGATIIDNASGITTSGANFVSTSIFNGQSISISSGGAQSVEVGNSTSLPLVAKVVDQVGSALKNFRVVFTATAGTVNPSSQLTDENGLASTTYSAIKTPGSQVVTAGNSYLIDNKYVEFGVDVTTGPAKTMTAEPVSSPQSVAAGYPFYALAVEVLDKYGNQVMGVPITFSSSTNTFTNQTTVVSNQYGRGIAHLDTDTVVGSKSAQAVVAGVPPVVFVLKVVPAAPDRIIILSGNSGTKTVASTIDPVSVKVVDSYNNTIPSLPINFDTVSGGGSARDASVTTDADGLASTVFTLGTSAGTQSFRAFNTTLPAGHQEALFTETALSDVPSSIAFTTQPPVNVTTGETFTTNPVVDVRDRFGNLVQSGTATLSAFDAACAATAPGTFSSSAGAISSGSAIFNGVTYSVTGTIKLRASIGNYSVCSNAVISNSPFVLSKTTQDISSTSTFNVSSLLSGGATPYSYSIAASTLGSKVDSTSGTFTAGALTAGTAVTNEQVGIIDASGSVKTLSFTVYPQLVISPNSKTLVTGNSFVFAASGGKAPFSFSSTVGSIGATSGTFTAGSVGSGVVSVSDALGSSTSATVAITSPPNISPLSPSLASGATQVFKASGGDGNFTYATTAGSMSGSTLTVSCAGGNSGSVTATDGGGNSATAVVSITGCYPTGIDGALSIPAASAYRLEQDPVNTSKVRVYNITTSTAVAGFQGLGSFTTSALDSIPQSTCSIDLTSLSIPLGSSLEAGPECRWTVMGVSGDASINGSLKFNKGEHAGGQWAFNLPDVNGSPTGAVTTYTINQQLGGSSGTGRSFSKTVPSCTGALYGNGSGAAWPANYYNPWCTNTTATYSAGGNGATNRNPLNNGFYPQQTFVVAGASVYAQNGVNSQVLMPTNSSTNSVASGGSRGRHGLAVYITVGGSISGSGTIDAAGQAGGKGGDSDTDSLGNDYALPAGGGSSGGSGGTVVVKHHGSTIPSSQVNVTGGIGGSGGAYSKLASPGQNGADGAVGSYTDLPY